MSESWSAEEIAEQWRLEVQQRFAAENLEWRRRDDKDIASARAILLANGEACEAEWLEPHDSALWDAYSACEIDININVVRVILPPNCAIGADFVAMFDGISVNWSHPLIGAEIIEGAARVVITVYLVDYWDAGHDG